MGCCFSGQKKAEVEEKDKLLTEASSIPKYSSDVGPSQLMSKDTGDSASLANLDANYAIGLIDSAKGLKNKWSTALAQHKAGDMPIPGLLAEIGMVFNGIRECTTREIGRGKYEEAEKIIEAATQLYHTLGRGMFMACDINSFCLEYLRVGPLVRIMCLRFFEPLTFYSDKPVDEADGPNHGNLLKHYMFSVYEFRNGQEELRFRYFLESSNVGFGTYYVVGLSPPDFSFHAQVQPMGMHKCPNYRELREVIGRDINQRVDRLEAGGSLL